jgi:hypothetical protein
MLDFEPTSDDSRGEDEGAAFLGFWQYQILDTSAPLHPRR